MTEPAPTQIGKYQLTDLLGQGAMGVVYRALDPLLNRYVAIKLMGQGITSDQGLRDRFLREAQAAGSLQHPNIITIFDFGETDGHLFIAMEYIEGADLSEIIDRKDPLPLPAKLDIMIDVLQALNYAHARKVVHRDIKPANIRVAVDGRAKLMDFGIARLESSNLTQSGMLIGTPNYMAPEQVTSGQVTPATDIFALGVVLYEFLTYKRTFDGDTLHAVLYKIVSEQPPPLEAVAHGVPDPLRKIVEKALAKDPKERFETAGDMARELTAVRTVLSAGKPVNIPTRMTPLSTSLPSGTLPSRPVRSMKLWAAIAAGVVVVAAAAFFLTRGRGATPQPTPAATAAAPSMGAPTTAAPSAPAAPVTTPRPETVTVIRPAPAASPGRTVQAPTGAPAPNVSARADTSRAAATPPATSAPASTPASQPSSAPAPAPTTPSPTPPPVAAPQSTAPAPAADPRADIEQLLAAYARAIESRNVGEIRRLYPGMTSDQEQGWTQFFQSMRSIRARLSLGQVTVNGSTADVSVNGAYDYDTGGGRLEHQPVTFHAVAAMDNGTWRFRTIR